MRIVDCCCVPRCFARFISLCYFLFGVPHLLTKGVPSKLLFFELCSYPSRLSLALASSSSPPPNLNHRQSSIIRILRILPRALIPGPALDSALYSFIRALTTGRDLYLATHSFIHWKLLTCRSTALASSTCRGSSSSHLMPSCRGATEALYPPGQNRSSAQSAR